MSETDTLQDLYDQVDDIVKKKSLDLSNITNLIKLCMEVVDLFSSKKSNPLSGEEKSKLVKDLIVYILNDLNNKDIISDEFNENIQLAVKFLSPIVFELIILADKGKFDLVHLHIKEKCCCLLC